MSVYHLPKSNPSCIGRREFNITVENVACEQTQWSVRSDFMVASLLLITAVSTDNAAEAKYPTIVPKMIDKRMIGKVIIAKGKSFNKISGSGKISLLDSVPPVM